MAKPPLLTEKKLIAMSPDMVEAIRDFRFANRIETESEAIRRLIRTSLLVDKHLRPLRNRIAHAQPIEKSEIELAIVKLFADIHVGEEESGDSERRSVYEELLHSVLSGQ